MTGRFPNPHLPDDRQPSSVADGKGGLPYGQTPLVRLVLGRVYGIFTLTDWLFMMLRPSWTSMWYVYVDPRFSPRSVTV